MTHRGRRRRGPKRPPIRYESLWIADRSGRFDLPKRSLSPAGAHPARGLAPRARRGEAARASCRGNCSTIPGDGPFTSAHGPYFSRSTAWLIASYMRGAQRINTSREDQPLGVNTNADDAPRSGAARKSGMLQDGDGRRSRTCESASVGFEGSDAGDTRLSPRTSRPRIRIRRTQAADAGDSWFGCWARSGQAAVTHRCAYRWLLRAAAVRNPFEVRVPRHVAILSNNRFILRRHGG